MDRRDLWSILVPLTMGIILISIGLKRMRIKPAFYTPSPLCWPGGKKKLVKEILKRIPPHRIYVEPMIGAGHIYWAKTPSEVEVINDINPELMKWYKELKTKEVFNCDLTPSKERFYEIKEKQNRSFCDFLYLTKLSYGCAGEHFGKGSMVKSCLERDDPSKCTVERFANDFDKYRQRMRNTLVLNKDYREVLHKYDSPETFFYIDPPFWRLSCPYGEGGCEVTPQELADAVKDLEGKVLISYNDHPDVREAFKGWKIEEVETKYELQRSVTGKPKQVKELLIRNY